MPKASRTRRTEMREPCKTFWKTKHAGTSCDLKNKILLFFWITIWCATRSTTPEKRIFLFAIKNTVHVALSQMFCSFRLRLCLMWLLIACTTRKAHNILSCAVPPELPCQLYSNVQCSHFLPFNLTELRPLGGTSNFSFGPVFQTFPDCFCPRNSLQILLKLPIDTFQPLQEPNFDGPP